jgi:hypothetical protein
MAVQDVSQQTKQNDRDYSHPNRIMASPACYLLPQGYFWRENQRLLLYQSVLCHSVGVDPRPSGSEVLTAFPTKRTKCHVITIGSLSCAAFSHYFAATISASFISADYFFAFLFCQIRSCFDDDDAGFCHFL